MLIGSRGTDRIGGGDSVGFSFMQLLLRAVDSLTTAIEFPVESVPFAALGCSFSCKLLLAVCELMLLVPIVFE
ncbi:MAG: hypothetical protein EBZ13_15090 [Planctomycetia bacterium]|nr:hypothetical protein [Planctomycetia bacterium]